MSKIEWTDTTDNPLRLATGGHYCEKVSPGCMNCYAEVMNQSGWYSWANGQPYRPTEAGPPKMALNTEMLASWARARKPKKRFVCSMTDLFGHWVTKEAIYDILSAMAAAPKQTFQILTKRPEWALREVYQWLAVRQMYQVLPANIWLGISAEDQQRLDERLQYLIETPVQTRFLSLEPLLGPITLPVPNDIDWVIIGGESGPNARPLNINWIRDILEQCRMANIPVFIKQLGTAWTREVGARHPKGGDWAEWHPDFWVQMWPGESWDEMAGGRF